MGMRWPANDFKLSFDAKKKILDVALRVSSRISYLIEIDFFFTKCTIGKVKK